MKLITAYLHIVHGDDARAILDDKTAPFKTHGAAMRALMPHIPDANNCTRIIDISGEKRPISEDPA